MEARDEGTTSVSKTSVENVVRAALREGLLARACWPDSDIAVWPPRSGKEIYVPSSVLISPYQRQTSEMNTYMFLYNLII